MRWNVVIGGQLFSKSFLGYTTYKMDLVTREGLLHGNRADAAAVCDLRRAGEAPAAVAGRRRPHQSLRRLPCRNPELDALAARFAICEARVARVESAMGLSPGVPAGPRALARRLPRSDARAPATRSNPPRSLLPVLGRALLGLAGAYLLRALTESGTFSPRMGVAIGLVYAMLWLVWAARTPAARRLETALHSLTSVLVLSPLLWEATLRFHAISTWTAGALLLTFTALRTGGLLAQRPADRRHLRHAGRTRYRHRASLLATDDVLPFTFVFLAIAAGHGSLRLPRSLAERALAGRRCRRPVGAARHLAGDQRARLA